MDDRTRSAQDVDTMRDRLISSSIVVATAVLSGAASAASPLGVYPDGPVGAGPCRPGRGVRAGHPNPFAINPEETWVAKLAELHQSLPTANPDEQVVQVASLVGLLDTHSWFTAPGNAYDVLLYPFADGWFVVRARDTSLVGARLISINGMPAADVEAAMRPMVPADNESGELDGLQYPMTSVEYLHGSGIVDDPGRPGYVFQLPDGSQATVDLTSSPASSWEQQLGIIGDLMGDAPEAVARRAEPAWGRLDAAPTRTFLFSYNDYTEGDLAAPIAAMRTALDDGTAEAGGARHALYPRRQRQPRRPAHRGAQA